MSRSFARIAIPTVLGVEGLGILSALLSNSGYGNPWFDALRKPAIMPPGWLFPVAWTILYALIGLALARIIRLPQSRARRVAIGLFAVQLTLNFVWSPVFFGLHRPVAGLGIILAMLAFAVLATMAFARLDRRAAWLMAPYLVWLCFAATLNAEILRLN